MEVSPETRATAARMLRRAAEPIALTALAASAAICLVPGQALVASAAAGAHIGGTVTAAPGGLPDNLSLLRHNGATATVTWHVTTVTRRYGGATEVAAVSMGDRLTMQGSFEPGTTTFDATQIQDMSIQKADAYARGTISSVDAAANSFVFHVTNAPNGSPLSGDVTVDLSADQTIGLPNGTTETIGGLQIGDRIYARGVYNRQAHILNNGDSIRVLQQAVQTPPQTAAIQLTGFAFNRRHYVTVHVHAAPNVTVHVVIRVNRRTLTATGKTGAAGTTGAT